MANQTKTSGPVSGSPKAVSDRYGPPVETVRKMVRLGQLKATKTGRRIYIKFSDAEKALLK